MNQLDSQPIIASKPTRQLLSLGLLAAMLFWTATLIGGWLHGHYSHLTDAVSDLGTVGSGSALFMAGAEIAVAVLTIGFLVGLFRACGQNRLHPAPVWLLCSFPVSIAGIAFYPLPYPEHALFGNLSLPVLVSPLLALLLWRTASVWPLRWWAGGAIGIMLLVFFRFIPDLQAHFGGLVQRAFHLGWSVWFVGLWYSMRKM